MSAIQKRIIRELYDHTTLSVKNMYKIRCSNISREIIRQFEEPFGLTLNRKRIDWSDEFSSGWYYEYSLDKKDRDKLEKIYVDYIVLSE